MKEILHQVNGVPEVVGSLVCDTTGQVLGHDFPPLFDVAIVQKAASLLTDSSLPLQNGTAMSGMLDLRYSDGRIIARELHGGLLMVLCTKAVNLAMLNISLNVAKAKLEQLLPSTADTAAQTTTTTPASTGEGALVACRLESSAASRGFNELGMVGMNHLTARQIGDRHQCGSFKKVTIANQKNGTTGTFPVMLINDETNQYDDMLILSPAIEKKLGAAAGDPLVVTPIT
ncbi:roadblock/LC7 domain-containing protein [Geomobilimonas luticola]|uniref:Roadblock/LC7 domain-containing protein n=1 Tax=Geomobilimonas luticola TaxID=1114878 RepID=A0ABS5SE33_9BACT|nr:roadblock/LC7 domain-containing protein [Geomobilimonas luticola]MBT0653636.1 roadblock/LC7 domain-containing protein [Geomobilimonas luticola]